MNRTTKLLIGIILVGVLIFAVPKIISNITSVPSEYDDFARCLKSSGATMYGAYWCPHCQDQKKLFGGSVKYINYVECDPRGDNANPGLCSSKGVEGYPTWEFLDGSFVSGKQTLEFLAIKSGCKLP